MLACAAFACTGRLTICTTVVSERASTGEQRKRQDPQAFACTDEDAPLLDITGILQCMDSDKFEDVIWE